MNSKHFRCWEDEACFARTRAGRCRILQETYPESRCPFRKAEIDVTSGVRYPYSEEYMRRAQ